MSNQLHLYVTNLTSTQEAFDDECEGGNLQEPLLEVPGDLIALLWIPMFKGVVWQDVLDKEQWDEVDEDEDVPKEDFILRMPLIDIKKAVLNLKDSEPNISLFFKENGGVKCLVDELVKILENVEYKYVYFNPACGDFCYSRAENKEVVDKILAICNGDFSEKKENIAADFGLQLKTKNLFSSTPIKFKSSKEVFSSDSEYNPIDGYNTYFLAGILDEEY